MLENEEKRSVESYNLHLIHKIILNIAEKFGADVALEKLDELEKQIMMLVLMVNVGVQSLSGSMSLMMSFIPCMILWSR